MRCESVSPGIERIEMVGTWNRSEKRSRSVNSFYHMPIAPPGAERQRYLTRLSIFHFSRSFFLGLVLSVSEDPKHRTRKFAHFRGPTISGLMGESV